MPNLPAAHRSHSRAAGAVENRPPRQLAHAEAPAPPVPEVPGDPSVLLPGTHAGQTLLPAAPEALPAAQALQAACAGSAENLPGAHSTHEDAPAAGTLPAVHAAHADAPVPPAKWPPAHATHAVLVPATGW